MGIPPWHRGAPGTTFAVRRRSYPEPILVGGRDPLGVDHGHTATRNRPDQPVWYLRCENWNETPPTQTRTTRTTPSYHGWHLSARDEPGGRSRPPLITPPPRSPPTCWSRSRSLPPRCFTGSGWRTRGSCLRPWSSAQRRIGRSAAPRRSPDRSRAATRRPSSDTWRRSATPRPSCSPCTRRSPTGPGNWLSAPPRRTHEDHAHQGRAPRRPGARPPRAPIDRLGADDGLSPRGTHVAASRRPPAL